MRILQISVALAAPFAALGCGDSDSPQAPVKPGVPVQAAELAGLAKSLHQPVYWAGRQSSTRFDLTRQGADRIFVRYLPSDGGAASAGGVLSVGTYRLKGAYAAIVRAGKAPGAKTFRLPGHGRAVAEAGNQTVVHLAYRSRPFQIEVFDPAPGRALELVRNGRIVPVPGSP
jgi:hypothetical protein